LSAAHEVVPASLDDRDLVRPCPRTACIRAPDRHMKGDAVRLRLGTTISVALLVGVTIAGSTAGARPAPLGSVRAARPNAAPDHGSKVPWGSGAARVVPHQIVVVWKTGAALTAERTLSARLGTIRVAPTPRLGVDVVRIPPGRSVGATLRAFRQSPLVRSAEPDRIATISTTDSHFGQQWALENTGQTHRMTDQGGPGTTTSGTADADVDAPEAWAAQTQHDPVVVAVLDTGVDVDHPDLVDRMWVNADEQGGTPGVDDDLNGFKDDVNGWDFFDHDANPTPSNGIGNSHGTHVAGIVAAEQDNAEGISGVCPDCQIMALRVGTVKTLSLGAELKAINYAIANGADVINMSFGSSIWSKSERSAINKAGKHGVLVVIAAGNGSSDNDIQFYDADATHAVPAIAPAYPATYTLKNILAVAATNDRDNYAYFSQCRGQIPLWACGFTNWGHDSVDVAAPGVDILSTVKVGQGFTFGNYEFFDGTSMASPLVAGVAGLVLSEHPGYSAVQVKNAIMNSVDHPSSLKLFDSWGDVTKVGKKPLTGKFTRTHGRVNAFDALSAPTTNATPLTDGNIDGARSIKAKRTGRVGWPADANDVFKRKFVKGSKYKVVLNGPKGRDFDLWVWRPGTKEIFQFTAGCFRRGGACPALEAASAGRTADEAVTFKASKSGVFYIQVNGWYSGGNYTLTVKKV
jgi:subtilisin family serine protease